MSLTINQRQAGYTNSAWRDILSRARIGTSTLADITALSERCVSIPSDRDSPDKMLESLVDYFIALQQEHPDPVCLVPTKAMTDRFNKAVIRRLHPNTVKVSAIDRVDCTNPQNERKAENAIVNLDKLEDPRNTAGLEKCLQLAVGVKVMLRQNLDVKNGLVNGSVGYTTNIDYSRDGKTIQTIGVLFRNQQSPVQIKRVRRKIQLFPGAFLHREMFPICLSYCLSIHKSQGLSLQCVFVDLGKSIFARSQTYVAISRVTTIAGLHLINFSPSDMKVNKSALAEYLRLGSKSSVSNIGAKRKNSATVVPERVWYISANRKKGESSVKANVKASTKFQNKRKAKPAQKGKSNIDTPVSSRPRKKAKFDTSKHDKSPIIRTRNKARLRSIAPQFININSMTTVEDSVFKIFDLIRQNGGSYESFFMALLGSNEDASKNTTRHILETIVYPFGDQLGDTLQRRLANELNPDPFGLADSNPQQKWLSSDLLNIYGMYLRDMSTTLQGPSVYHVAPYARYLYCRNRRTNRYIRDYIDSAHTERQYSVLMPQDYNHSHQTALSLAGDPFEKDIIIMFCNDRSSHWYLIIVDLRRHTIMLFDSGAFSRSELNERCSFAINFLNDLRSYVMSNYRQISFTWDRSTPLLSETDFHYVDGQSCKQGNGFDCGVFAMINGDRFVRNMDNKRFAQNYMPLVRVMLIRNLFSFAMAADVPM